MWKKIKSVLGVIGTFILIIIGMKVVNSFNKKKNSAKDEAIKNEKQKRKGTYKKINGLAKRHGGVALIILFLLVPLALSAWYTNINLQTKELYVWPDKDTYIRYAIEYSTNQSILVTSYSNENQIRIEDEPGWLERTWDKNKFCIGGVLGAIVGWVTKIFVDKAEHGAYITTHEYKRSDFRKPKKAQTHEVPVVKDP